MKEQLVNFKTVVLLSTQQKTVRKPTAPRGKDWSVRAPCTIHTEELAGSESWSWLKPGDIMEELEGLKNVRGNII